MGRSDNHMSAAVQPSSRCRIPLVCYQATSPTLVSSQSQILPSMDISGTRPRMIGSSTPSFPPRDLPLPWGPPAVQLSNRTAGKPVPGAGDTGRDGEEGGDRQGGDDGDGEVGGDKGVHNHGSFCPSVCVRPYITLHAMSSLDRFYHCPACPRST